MPGLRAPGAYVHPAMQVNLASVRAEIRSLDKASTHEAWDDMESRRLHLVELARNLATDVQYAEKAHDLAMQQLERMHRVHDTQGNF